MNTRSLAVKLTDQEVQIRGQRLASLRAEIGEIEHKKKVVNQELKGEIESREKECASLVRQITSGQEYRGVIVKEVENWDAQTVNTIRVDTGGTVDIRAMTPKELQRPIPFEPHEREEATA